MSDVVHAIYSVGLAICIELFVIIVVLLARRP